MNLTTEQWIERSEISLYYQTKLLNKFGLFQVTMKNIIGSSGALCLEPCASCLLIQVGISRSQWFEVHKLVYNMVYNSEIELRSTHRQLSQMSASSSLIWFYSSQL